MFAPCLSDFPFVKNRNHYSMGTHAFISGAMIGIDSNSYNSKIRWFCFQIKINCRQTTAKVLTAEQYLTSTHMRGQGSPSLGLSIWLAFAVLLI